MTTRKRRFFSGPSLEAALVLAASEYGLAPEDVSYRLVEKRHGFLKIRRNTVIEVDPEAPLKLEAGRGRGEGRDEDAKRRHREKEEGAGGLGGDKVGTEAALEPERSVGEAAEGGAEDTRSEESKEGRREPGPREREGLARVKPSHEPIELRLKKAEGPLAKGARNASEWLLDLVDLDVDAEVYEGEERFEVELRGPDRGFLVEQNGEVLSALEHLIPRVMRGVCGDSYPIRVDSENFQEQREDRLRNLAWDSADRVRREGQPRILEAMDPADRRIVHLALADHPDVTTRSLGDGFFKRVKVLLR